MAKRKAKNVYLMPEPKWSELALIKDEVKQHKMIRDMEYFVHYEVADKKCSATVMHWLEKDSGLDLQSFLRKLKRVPDVWFSTFAKHTFIWSQDRRTCTMRYEHHLLEKIPPLEDKAEAIMEKLEEKKADAKPKISIQQRMLEQITDLCGAWDEILDGYVVANKFDVSSFDPEKDMKIFSGGVIKPAHAKLVKDQYTMSTRSS